MYASITCIHIHAHHAFSIYEGVTALHPIESPRFTSAICFGNAGVASALAQLRSLTSRSRHAIECGYPQKRLGYQHLKQTGMCGDCGSEPPAGLGSMRWMGNDNALCQEYGNA